MTRRDFIEDVTCWYELEDFCAQADIREVLEDVYDDEAFDSMVTEDIIDYLQNWGGWRDLDNIVNDLPGGWDRYIHYGDSLTDWQGSDDGDERFEEYKGYVIERADDDELWDEDEEDETNPTMSAGQEDDLPLFEEEDFSIYELIEGEKDLKSISQEPIEDVALMF